MLVFSREELSRHGVMLEVDNDTAKFTTAHVVRLPEEQLRSMDLSSSQIDELQELVGFFQVVNVLKKMSRRGGVDGNGSQEGARTPKAAR
jgi:hypothetical protein